VGIGLPVGNRRQHSLRRHHIPLIKSMAPAYGGADKIEPLRWCLSLGPCLGGNGTLIGASANLTVASIAERNGVSFRLMTYTYSTAWSG
jgi:Na+/H+ antiporter NhaD/arsenite permease-like protein